VTKDIGPIDAIKESAAIFKRTWGENVVGTAGLSWAIFFCYIGWTASMFTLGYVVSLIAPAAVLGVVGIGLAGYVFIGLMGSALGGIYTAALYRYAMTGETGMFDAQLVGNAFRAK